MKGRNYNLEVFGRAKLDRVCCIPLQQSVIDNIVSTRSARKWMWGGVMFNRFGLPARCLTAEGRSNG
jgi:hypothetical protein